jgi:uncharacterized protein (DUF3084 family)
LFMFAALGALIAYFADRLGRNLGKKRLSLFGLRPRHTAELLTVAAGAIVPILTVLLVIALSAPVREWLINGPRLLQQRDEARRDLASLILKNRDQQMELEKTNAALTTFKGQVQTLQASVKELGSKEQGLQNQVNVKQGQLTVAQGQLSSAKTQLASAQTNFNTVNQQLKSTASQLKSTAGQITVVKLQLDMAKKEYRNAQSQTTQANGNLSRLKTTYADLNKTYTDLNKSYTVLTQQKDEATTEVRSLEANIEEKRKELESAAFYVEQANQKEAKAWASSRKNGLIFADGDEVSREFAPAHLSYRQAQQLVGKAIEAAGEEAALHGAGKNRSGYEAGLVDLPIGKDGQLVTARQMEEDAVKLVTDSPQPMVVVARAFWNTFQQESVPLVLEVHENPLVYRRNQPIAETFVQGSLTDQQIFQQLADFGKKVEARAKQDKMIPVAGRDESFGEVAPGEVVSLVEKIHNWGKSARLIAMASQDTHAGDSLVLKFDLRQ